jgi:hypothetical protein
MRYACLTLVFTALVFTALIFSFPGEIRGEAAFLHIAGADGTVIVDTDTIAAGSTLIAMEPGRHFLTHLPFENETRWKPPLADLPIHLEEGETLSVDLGSTITVRIESKPAGCRVKRAQSDLGSTPLVLSTLTGFPDTLTLALEGYLPAVISPSGLSDGSIFYVLLVSQHGLPAREGSIEKSRGNGRGALLKYSSLAASLASISLGFWYKQKADSYYDDYLSHGNPETLERLYKKSVEMDDRARVFWIAGEAGAIITSYFFLKDFFSGEKRQERLYENP